MGDTCRYAVVTGANKGIGFETVKQLANSGVTVVLTARNEKRGMKAASLLNEQGFSNVVFHQLDVQDAKSIESLAEFVQTQYGRLDILVNNAGAGGVVPDEDVLRALKIDLVDWLPGKTFDDVRNVMKTTYESANYAWTLITMRMPNEERRKELGDIENLTEDKIDEILQNFMHDLKQDALEVNGWQMNGPAYAIAKLSVNAYTRVLARRYPKMCINCVHPGFVNTDMS